MTKSNTLFPHPVNQKPYLSLDVMLHDIYQATLRMPNPYPRLLTVQEVEDFVLKKMPTLKGKKFEVYFNK